MAQVRMLRALRSAGHNGEHFPPVGEIAEVDDAKAKALVRFKYAEHVEAETADVEPDEAADVTPAETADVAAPETRTQGK